jgi:hypothetical protein
MFSVLVQPKNLDIPPETLNPGLSIPILSAGVGSNH